MKRCLLWSSVFGLAVVIGVGAAVVTYEPAVAFSCEIYNCATYAPHSTISDDPCTCPSGATGVVGTRWCGYDAGGGHCGFWYNFCTACPPRGEKGPWPYYDPGGGQP
ncbi:MAG: hypothetical protein GYA46_08910 [candidate division Zixibacteria bacterium]|nr:hypothetical protein [candidate division Zixibacteria bacterium]